MFFHSVVVPSPASSRARGTAIVTLPNVPNPAAVLFGEDQGRFLVTARDPQAIIDRATKASLFAAVIGTVGGQAVEGPNFSASLTDLRAAHEGFFPKLMGGEHPVA